ncbi:MAG: tripartite tricarboxylate transporter substrate-binding protein [Burkholderiales bacterium]
MKRLVRVALAAAAAIGAGGGHAQTYPAKAVRIVAAYPAGGSVDIVARMVGQRLTETMGRTFVIDNRSGASGNIGTEHVAKSAPDGYTLLMDSAAALAQRSERFHAVHQGRARAPSENRQGIRHQARVSMLYT